MSEATTPAPAVVVASATPKSGFLTSEFALTVGSLIVAGLVAANVVPASEEKEIEGMLGSVISAVAQKDMLALVMAIVPVVTYVKSRGILKAFLHQSQAVVPVAPVAPVATPADPFKV
jgi:hypothetical protein